MRQETIDRHLFSTNHADRAFGRLLATGAPELLGAWIEAELENGTSEKLTDVIKGITQLLTTSLACLVVEFMDP